MCGRYTILIEDEIIGISEILKNLSLHIVRNDFEKNKKTPGEIFPTNHAPVITKNNDGIVFENVKWGFKKWNSSGVIINARVETIRNKITFSKHLETGRCVVPVSEFFEWEKLNTGKKKYYAKDKKGNPLFLAGLYRDVKDVNEPKSYIREFVIITKASTGEMAKIHDRIPIILRVDQIEFWLTGEITPKDIEKMEYDISVNPCENEGIQLSLFDNWCLYE